MDEFTNTQTNYQRIIDSLTSAIDELSSLREIAIQERQRPTLDTQKVIDWQRETSVLYDVIASRCNGIGTLIGI